MKKTLMFIMLLSVFAAITHAQDGIPVPCCKSIEDIVKVIKKNDRDIITKLEKKDNVWTAESVTPDGSKHQYTLVCRQCEPPLETKKTSVTVPPADGLSLFDMTVKINAEYKGEIKKIEFVDNKWNVCIVINKIERQLLFDTKGKLISTSGIN